MKGDFSRDTFDPSKHFSRVLMQQGRVQLDADWNEQTSILLHYVRTLAADIIGPHAGPAVGMGFDLITKDTIENLKGSEQTVKWKSIEPNEDRRNILRNALKSGMDAVIGPGRYYVDGILVENCYPMLYTEQPGYPFTPGTELKNPQNSDLIFYLDVWERHITYVQDDHIREVALGGADTCTREQVVWQVKPLFPKDEGTFDCEHIGELLARKNLPLLRARARRETLSPELCSVSPESKYRGLENHLYRVEIHEIQVKGKEAGTINTFKWSRDNGCVVFPIVSLTRTTVIVASLGRDQCSQLKPGDWVEVCDDELALRGQSGPLAQVERVDRDELKVTLKWPGGMTDLPSYPEGETSLKHPLLRRWDHDGDLVRYRGALPITESTDSNDGWITLEDGVEIWFAEGKEFQVGDYWLIPARVATGDVEWPRSVGQDGQSVAAALPPHGPQHHYAPLLHVAKDGNEKKDCRCQIQHLPCWEENGG